MIAKKKDAKSVEIRDNCEICTKNEAYEMLTTGMIGGPSIVFCRHAEGGVSKIRSHIYSEKAKTCRSVLGLDSNSLYLFCSGQEMPCGKEKVFKCNPGEKAELLKYVALLLIMGSLSFEKIFLIDSIQLSCAILDLSRKILTLKEKWKEIWHILYDIEEKIDEKNPWKICLEKLWDELSTFGKEIEDINNPFFFWLDIEKNKEALEIKKKKLKELQEKSEFLLLKLSSQI